MRGLLRIKIQPRDTQNKPGAGLHMIQLWGARVPYEARFADLAACANETGATQYSFNPFGMNASKGQVYELNDVINCAFAMINQLLAQGISPDKIVLMGDCLGGAVMQEVQAACEAQGVQLRLINSNSFQSLKKHLQEELKKFHASYLVPFIKPLLQHLGWHMTPGKLFAYQTPYKTYLHRHDDQILVRSKLHDKIQRIGNKKKYVDNCPEEYKPYRDKLEQHCEVQAVQKKSKARDPHLLPLNELHMMHDLNKTAYAYINEYLEYSNCYIHTHPHSFLTDGKLLQPLSSSNFLHFKDKAEKNRNYKAFFEILALLKEKLGLAVGTVNRSLSYLYPRYRQQSRAASQQSMVNLPAQTNVVNQINSENISAFDSAPNRSRRKV